MNASKDFSYESKLAALEPLEEFSPDAFLEDADHPVALCRFILALAIVHNDLNDVNFAVALLKMKEPPSPVVKTRDWAFFNSVGLHLAKTRVALVHELLNLVRDNAKVFLLPSFAKLLKTLSKRDRDAWREIELAAKDDPMDTKFGKFLSHCRNKTVNHYDAKVLYAAYRRRFPKDSKQRPLLSRGNSMYSTKFFFADAAVEEVLFGGDHLEEARRFLFQENPLLASINLALFFLVTHFVSMRGHAWRRIKEGESIEQLYL